MIGVLDLVNDNIDNDPVKVEVNIATGSHKVEKLQENLSESQILEIIGDVALVFIIPQSNSKNC